MKYIGKAFASVIEWEATDAITRITGKNFGEIIDDPYWHSVLWAIEALMNERLALSEDECDMDEEDRRRQELWDGFAKTRKPKPTTKPKETRDVPKKDADNGSVATDQSGES